MAVRVLIIDDSIFARDILRHHLECLGCEVVAEAENTLQALHLFRTVKPSLVAMDAMVARAGNVGALALFRTMRGEDPRAQVIIVSAIPSPEIRKTFESEGAAAYVVKPFDAQSLERVRNTLERLFPELLRLPEHHSGAPLGERCDHE